MQDDSRGASNQGTNIQLDLLLTENEQKQKITEVQDTSVFSLPQNKEDISLEEKLYKFYNNYDIYDVDEVSMEQVKADLKDNESINETLKEGIDYFGTKIDGFSGSDAIIVAPETRTSSPIRIIRDENLESNILGIYPTGEGAGYAGGITTSAIDGIKVFEKIREKYHNFL